MKVTARVPATTANIGPGFDSFGMALPISNEITIEVVHAEHGYIPPMKSGAKVIENIGYIMLCEAYRYMLFGGFIRRY